MCCLPLKILFLTCNHAFSIGFSLRRFFAVAEGFQRRDLAGGHVLVEVLLPRIRFPSANRHRVVDVQSAR